MQPAVQIQSSSEIHFRLNDRRSHALLECVSDRPKLKKKYRMEIEKKEKKERDGEREKKRRYKKNCLITQRTKSNFTTLAKSAQYGTVVENDIKRH